MAKAVWPQSKMQNKYLTLKVSQEADAWGDVEIDTNLSAVEFRALLRRIILKSNEYLVNERRAEDRRKHD